MILKMEAFDVLLICFIILSLCTESLEVLINIMKREAPVQQRLKKTDDILSMLQQERNTCRLVNVLYKDRIERENINEDDMLVDSLGKRISDRVLIDNLFLQNSMLRHSQLAIDWLEKNAADDFSHKYHDKLEYFTENSISWEHTLYKLMTNRAQLDVRPSRERLITELDPDAPIRQRNLMLRNMDKENDLMTRDRAHHEMKTQICLREETLANCKIEVDALKSTIESLKNDLSQKENSLEDQNAHLLSKNSHISRLEQDIADLRIALATSKEELQKLMSSRPANENVESLRHKYDNLKEQLRGETAQKDSLKIELSKLTEELNNQKASLASSQQEIIKLQKEFETKADYS